MSLALNELSSVIPATVDVIAGGETFTLKRFSLGQLKDASAHAALIALLFTALQEQNVSPIEVITKGGDSVIELVAIATGKSAAWCEELDPEEGINLLLAVAEVNVSFFVNALSPSVSGWTERAKRLVQTVTDKKTETKVA